MRQRPDGNPVHAGLGDGAHGVEPHAAARLGPRAAGNQPHRLAQLGGRHVVEEDNVRTRVGGLREDLPRGYHEAVNAFLDMFPGKLDEFGGHETKALGYHYHASLKYPFINGGFHGEVVERDGQVDPQPRTNGVRPALPPLPGARQIFDVTLDLVQTSCGMAVPYLSYTGDRELLNEWAGKKGEEGLRQYWAEKNQLSLDDIQTNIVKKIRPQ